MNLQAYLYDQIRVSFDETSSKSIVNILLEDIKDIATFDKGEIDHLIQRIISGEPIQYVTGIAPFYGHFFQVDSHVLIPRPETEELVYTIEKYIKNKGLENCRILDIGTGSGCIPITLSKIFPKASIYGLDISEDALKVAKSNNEKLDTKVSFMKVDILNYAQWEEMQSFDIIISNPPYIPFEEKNLMAANVLDHEPHLALFVDNKDPLIFYRKIFEFAQSKQHSGAIFLECNEFNAVEVSQIFEAFYNTEIIKDLQQKDRMLKAIKRC